LSKNIEAGSIIPKFSFHFSSLRYIKNHHYPSENPKKALWEEKQVF
jgi:hypothetical protein